MKVHYRSLLLISQNTVVEYAWVPSSTEQNRPQRQLQELLLDIAIVISTLYHIHGPETRFNSEQRLSLINIHCPSTVDTKELFTPPEFQPWITNASARDSYLKLQPRGHFHELKLHYRNLSVSCEIIEPCLNTPEKDTQYHRHIHQRSTHYKPLLQ